MAVPLALLVALIVVVNGRPELMEGSPAAVVALTSSVDDVPEEEKEGLRVNTTTACNITFEVVYPTGEGDSPYPVCFSECPSNQELWFDGVVFKKLPELEALGLMLETTVRNGTIQGCRMVPHQSDNELFSKQETQRKCMDSCWSTERRRQEETVVAAVTEVIPPSADLIPLHKRLQGFTRLGNAYYLVSPGIMTWPNAVKYCEELGATLAVIESSEEQGHVRGALTTNVWIGISDIEDENVFVTTGNRRLRYSSWHRGEPNNYIGIQDCGVMLGSYGYNWDDLPCYDLQRALCKHPDQDDTHRYRCPRGYMKFLSSCYLVSRRSGMYIEGEEYCASIGGYPTFINSLEEHNFLAGKMTENVFIGISDREHEGIFISKQFGVPLFRRWKRGQPDDYYTFEDCGMLYRDYNYYWNDGLCEQSVRVLCEVPAEVVNE